MLDDARWIRLSDPAKAAWISILLIASEREDSGLPEPDILFRRLRALGHCQKKTFFTSLIHELNQCGFLTKTSPELQSYRVTESQRSVLRTDRLSAVDKKEVGEEERGETPDRSDSQPQSSLYLRLRSSARVIWESNRAAALIGAAYHKHGLTEAQILEVMREVVANSGDVNELAHNFWAASLH